MRDALRTGVLAGLLLGAVVGLLETVNALSHSGFADTPFYGLLLLPLFYWAVLLPAGALVGGALFAWQRLWHERDTLALRQWVMAAAARFRAGSPAALGWIVGGLVVVGSVLGAGTLAFLFLDERYRNRPLTGVLMTAVVCLLAVFFGAFVSFLVRRLGTVLAALRGTRLGPWLSPVRLSAAGGLALLSAAAWFAAANRDLLLDIGGGTIFWMTALPPLTLAAFAVAVAFAPRWRSVRRLHGVLVGLPVSGVLLAFGLGEIAVVRNAALVGDTPAAMLIGLYQSLSDFDGDGTSSFFGGADCEPFDPSIGPHAAEIPGNGVDENCLAGDVYTLEGDHSLRNRRAFTKLPPRFPDKPNLILITVDALRADHVHTLGYPRETTPEIDRYAKRGVVFERAYSQGTGTISSLPSLFTSKYAYQLRYTNHRRPPSLSKRETTLAEHLKGAGYSTFGVTPLAYMYDGRWRLSQGFDHLDKKLAHDHPTAAQRITSPKTLKTALGLLNRARQQKEPFLLWVHFYDTHASHLTHPRQKSFGTTRIDRYDGEILYTDRYVGKLLKAVLDKDAASTVVILGADHGDGFRSDRGMRNHGYSLFNELIHVPLVVWAPGAKPRRVDTPVANLDIAATLVNAAGLERPYLMGHSLIPYLYEGYRDPKRRVFSEAAFDRRRTRHHRSATGMRWKMIHCAGTDKEFLFDLEKDPGERRNLVRRRPKVARELRAEIGRFADRNAVDTLDLE